MTTELDPGLTLLAQLVARRGRTRLFTSVMVLTLGLAAIAYWTMPVTQNAFVERETMIHRVIGAIGAIVAIASALRLFPAAREAFGPTGHALYKGIAEGKLKTIVRNVGTDPLQQRFPRAEVKTVEIRIRRL